MNADVVVIGSGIAGLSFALRAARLGEVALITKKDRPESNTNYAQGGIAAVTAPDDSFDLHARDTLRTGAGLSHPSAVRAMVEEGPARVRELVELGVQFSVGLGREGGHSRRRIVHADDLTGRELERGLLAAVEREPRVRMLEDHFAVDLLTSGKGGDRRSAGVEVLEAESGKVVPVRARAVLLASGGCGRVYLHTTNPAIATGDGVAMAYRAGAEVANMEFVQFHPTALYPAGEHAFLLSEALRGEGAVLLRADGGELMPVYHPAGSLAPRDVVARAILREMKLRGDRFALLDCTRVPEKTIRERFPNIRRETSARGYDMIREPLPVVPAAHYLCGGVRSDLYGRTSLPGLYAAGEVACTGVHGANRLASNSLLEALVFARRAADRLASEGLPEPAAEVEPACREDLCGEAGGGEALPGSGEELRRLMWEQGGIVRSDAGLEQARERLEGFLPQSRTGGVEEQELRNLIQIGLLIVRSALLRRESRGLHFNTDHPHKDNELYLRDTVLARGDR